MASQVASIKWIPGTSFIVDGFAFASPDCQHYFLTHCHSDHTIGLSRRFSGATIYTTLISARILGLDFGLRAPVVQQLALNKRVVVEGVGVTPLDANHCPGACMFLFEVPKEDGGVTRVLHTGDCRWQDRLKHDTVLARLKVDVLYLDTTYCYPKHTFPNQADAIASMIKVLEQLLQEEPSTLIIMGAYHIGKERAIFAAADALDMKVCVTKAKLKLLQLLDLGPHHLTRLTTDPAATQLHVCSWGLAPEKLEEALQAAGGRWKAVVGVRATGWCYRRGAPGASVRRLSPSSALVTVPYSEHSSWLDLRACVKALNPSRLVPTVNASNPAASAAIVDRFADLMDLRQHRNRMDYYLLRGATPAAVTAEGAAAAAGGAAPEADRAGSEQTGALRGLPDARRVGIGTGTGAATEAGVVTSGPGRELEAALACGVCKGAPGLDGSSCCCFGLGMPCCAWRGQTTAQQLGGQVVTGVWEGQGASIEKVGRGADVGVWQRPADPPLAAAAVAALEELQVQGEVGPEGPGAAGGGDVVVDLSAVDMEEQHRLWEYFMQQQERQQRLKRSLQLQ